MAGSENEKANDIKSHIQIPKFILKSFSHKTENGNCVYYLDLKDKKIKEEKINTLGTEFGFYDEQVESELSEKYEQPFAKIAKIARGFSERKLTTIVLNDYEKTIKDFFTVCMFRSKDSFEMFKNISLTAQLFPKGIENLYMKVSLSKIDSFQFFDDFKVNILINSTKMSFVTIRQCYYPINIDDSTCYALPINSKAALLLQPEETFQKHMTNNELYYARVSTDEDVTNINYRAFLWEKQFNNDFVVAKEKAELTKLLG